MKLETDWLDFPQVKKLVKVFDATKDNFRFVGGVVRDSVLGIKAGDIDAATIFTPQEVTEILARNSIKTIPTGIKHGTVTALIDGMSIEITTLRKDISCDGRHARVIFTDNWHEDAARRDFTINALYLASDGELFDYFGGINDAHKGIVRFIGNAQTRIKEDYLRILRFFRFHAYYGRGNADSEALLACYELAPMMESLSGERISGEMLKILAAPEAFSVLKLMENNSLLKTVCGFNLRVDRAINNTAGNPQLCLAILLLATEISPNEALNIIAERWRLSGGLKKRLSLLMSYIEDMSEKMPVSKQKHLLRKLGKDVFSSLILLKKAIEPQSSYDDMLNLANSWQIPHFPVSGDDLIKMGIKEGKELGKKLHKLEKIWEDSDYKVSKEELLNTVL